MVESLLVRSTRGMEQELEFRVAQSGSGFCVSSVLRIAGCLPKRGPSMTVPLPYEAAMAWTNSRLDKMARSPAAFRPARSPEDMVEAMIEAMFFGPRIP